MVLNMVDYKVSLDWYVIRWKNWNNFVENISWKKNKDTALLTIHFNNLKNIKYLIDYEQDADIDFVVIENSTKNDEKLKLKQYIEQKRQNITLISPISNIWSAWWYALWMEYIMDCDYDYFYIVEDDVIFLEDGVINELLKIKKDNTLTFINNCKNTWSSKDPSDKWHSWWVQVAWYPTSFVKKIWIIDPRYFFRWEDLERWYKIENWIKQYCYKVEVLDRNYVHPYLKPINKNYAFVYFSIRNQLFSLKKNWSYFKWILFTIFFYLYSWFSKIITELDSELLKSVLLWVKDFLKMNYSFKSNLKNIWNFINKNENSWRKYNILELKNIIRNCYWNKYIMQITWYNNEQIPKYSINILKILYWIIVSSNSTALSFFTLLSKHVVNVESISIKNDEFLLTYKNKSIINYVFWFLAFFIILPIAICVYLLVLVAIIFNIVSVKLFSK